MHLSTSLLLLMLGMIVSIESTEVKKCTTDEIFADPEAVKISDCEKPPCKLKKRTKIAVEIKLKPDHDIPKLENSVFALIVGVPFPFVGVDGTDACSNVFNIDGTKAGCPLKANQDYVYKNAFDILEIYPRIKVNVQWALREPVTGKNAHCFKVQSRIVA